MPITLAKTHASPNPFTDSSNLFPTIVKTALLRISFVLYYNYLMKPEPPTYCTVPFHLFADYEDPLRAFRWSRWPATTQWLPIPVCIHRLLLIWSAQHLSKHQSFPHHCINCTGNNGRPIIDLPPQFFWQNEFGPKIVVRKKCLSVLCWQFVDMAMGSGMRCRYHITDCDFYAFLQSHGIGSISYGEREKPFNEAMVVNGTYDSWTLILWLQWWLRSVVKLGDSGLHVSLNRALLGLVSACFTAADRNLLCLLLSSRKTQ